MDLPTCPSCKQSVLDDDAEFCPFCGSSMTGKPGKAPAAPTSAGSAKPSATGAASSAASKAAKQPAPSKKSAQADDPFAIEIEGVATEAIPVSPKRTASRPHPVVCPMCEAKGYIPAAAAGRDVRCHNKSCMMPVFTAPEIEKAPPPPKREEPVEKKSGSGALLPALIVVILLAAGGTYWFLTRPPASTKQEDVFKQLLANNGGPAAKQPSQSAPAAAEPNSEDESKEEAPTPEMLAAAQAQENLQRQQEILTAMVRAAERNESNRSKPYCRRLTAYTYARAADLSGARDQLRSLAQVGAEIPHYRIPPLVAIAWQQLAENKTEDATATINEAVGYAGNIPQLGRDSREITIDLATILAATGRADEARQLVRDHEDAGAEGQLAAALAISRSTGDFDLDSPLPGDQVGGWNAPLRVAVTVGLAARNYWDQARAFAEQSSNPDARTESLIALADMRLREAIARKTPAGETQAREYAASLPEAGKARLLAALAVTHLQHGDGAAAEKLLTDAQVTFKAIAPPAAIQFEGAGRLLRLTLPEAQPLRQAALAAAEIARGLAQQNQTDAAWEVLQQGLVFARGIAPSPAAVAELRREIKAAGSTTMRERLKQEFELRSEDEARRKYSDLLRKLGDVEKGATDRFNLQLEILSAGATWGLAGPIWIEARNLSREADPNLREPYLESSLPKKLMAAFEDAGQAEQRQLVEEQLAGVAATDDALFQLQRNSARAVRDGKLEEAAKMLSKSPVNPAHEAWALRLACRMAKDNQTDSLLEFARKVDNILVREEILRVASALLVKTGGQRDELWKKLQELSLTQTERVSAGCGLIEGTTPVPGLPQTAPQPVVESAPAG